MDKNEGALQERERPTSRPFPTQGTRPQLKPQCLSSDPGKMTPPQPFLSLAGGLQVRLGLASSEAPFLGGGMGWFTAGSGEAAPRPRVPGYWCTWADVYTEYERDPVDPAGKSQPLP